MEKTPAGGGWAPPPGGGGGFLGGGRSGPLEQSYDIWLDEKKKLSDEDYRNPNIVARGYTDYVTIQDYPMRGRPVFLHMRKNKWWDKQTNEIFSYNLELPNDEGTRLSAEFVAF